MKRILICTPTYDGNLSVFYVDSLMKTKELCSSVGIDMQCYFVAYEALVQRARNDIFKIMYENEFDCYFFIDADMSWMPEHVVKLANSEFDLIGGTARKKKILENKGEEEYVIKALKTEEGLFKIEIDDQGIAEVSGVGTGFLKLSRKAVIDLYENSEKYIDSNGSEKRMVFNVIINNGKIMSEDYFMCETWKNLGNKIYLDTAITCGHLGNTLFLGDVRKWIISNMESKK